MDLSLVWFDHGELKVESFHCTGDIDFQACDDMLWNLVQDGFIVSLAMVDDNK